MAEQIRDRTLQMNTVVAHDSIHLVATARQRAQPSGNICTFLPPWNSLVFRINLGTERVD